MLEITPNNIHRTLRIPVDNSWNYASNKELKMHNIHAYPAKFPSFIASKVFEYATTEGVTISKVADIFCGCGTVSLEAQLHNYDFWGCDINPVATLISKVKSKNYNIKILERYYNVILDHYTLEILPTFLYENANERLKYWFSQNTFNELYKIKRCIKNFIPTGKYQDAFLCIFSSILKSCSRWLNKSIKPQIDPYKQEINVIEIFKKQYNYFKKAVGENKQKFKKETIIKNDNFLTIDNIPNIDLIVTSPPYVTSYEYADLHQLSSLWLNYTNDYKALREGSVGSIYNSKYFDLENIEINEIGKTIIENLSSVLNQAKLKSIARYYTDMELALDKCYHKLNENGMIFLVIGDTEYKGIKIENSKHLLMTLHEKGFTNLKIARRKISNKLLTPYRDENGKFTSDKTKREIYHEEFLISGRKF
ncbi:DNA methyltransferase [Candidatus Ruminimicrobium bovinum]|uniref:DNA methyltransferase n=1 Tax=Candidatus Ruminimicrobium bovinum TaxID=3242779 RepID=UPI0039B9248E